MIVLKVLAIIAIVFVALFLLTLVIYFFNLDMKFAADAKKYFGHTQFSIVDTIPQEDIKSLLKREYSAI